jgi:uncharacterized repeat protein (TIGR01451 family)
MRPSNRSGGRLRAVVGLLTLALLAIGAPPVSVAISNIGAVELGDRDFRDGSIQPSAAQKSAVSKLGAKARWNRFGTPQSLIRYGGWLATGISGSAEVAARKFIRTNRALFRLSDTDVTRLELVAVNELVGSSGRAVLFRQRYGGLPAAQDGLIIVGLRDGNVAYVSSSATGSLAAPQAATLSPTAAWLKAASSVGLSLRATALEGVTTSDGWTTFTARPLGTSGAKGTDPLLQRARLVAVPTIGNGARAAYETIVLDLSGASPLAYAVFVDARTGAILMRYNRVNHADHEGLGIRPAAVNDDPTFGQFSGITDQPNECGPDHPITAPAGTITIDIVASATIPANDITVHLADATHTVIASNTETGTSPEALHHEFGAPTAGTFYARVCQFNAGDEPFTYEGAFATNDVASTATDFQYPPTWQYFRSTPKLDLSNTDSRLIGCWVLSHNGATIPECSSAIGKLQNLAARVPWDHLVQANVPSYTTIGNNAVSGEAWTTPLTPGPAQQRPVHLDRRYADTWANTWQESGCDPTSLTPAGNDIDAAVTNLFVAHNRMHDWSYFLGFTEDAWNLQENNFGNNPGAGQEHDPEFGQAQSGALLPVEAGVSRDNANQITLNDGVPGITNMYLWQPIAGGFYAPCVDGDFDMSVIGHEYTHAISNRMAGGPDANLTGTQAGAMGESWSDLAAVEYLNEYGLVPINGESPFAVGPYVTGNKQRGIRNYNMSASPLNYSDIGYDFVCNPPLVAPELEGTCPDGRTQVHADGEIWSAVNYDIRQALIAKYKSSYPASNMGVQKGCADGVRPAKLCPGNRRWIQMMFDAWLLMPSSVSMLDARDAYLAADMLRFDGKNQTELWRAFARRGMGNGASTTGPSDVDPTPDFSSPREANRSVRFRVYAADEGGAPITNAKIYVGQYEAGVTPIADTIPGGAIDDIAPFVPGSYEFLVVAPGYGFVRFPRNFTAGSQINVNVNMSTNRASLAKGAVATGTGSDVSNMFDDTELTQWSGSTPVGAQLVTVDLQGGVQTVRRVNVSAMLSPEAGGRFRALRQFEIWTCNGTCLLPTDFTKIYTSPADAFPGVRPRPAAPDLILRSFNVPDTTATHVQLRVVSNQCTATGTGFRGEQDSDPLNDTDCVSGSDMDLIVRAAELQVFSSSPALPSEDPAVIVTVNGPASAASGSKATYAFSYTNAGPAAASDAVLTSKLPAGVAFISASNGGTYKSSTRTVRWSLGKVLAGTTGQRSMVVRLKAASGSLLTIDATFTAPATIAVTIPGVTAVI